MNPQTWFGNHELNKKSIPKIIGKEPNLLIAHAYSFRDGGHHVVVVPYLKDGEITDYAAIQVDVEWQVKSFSTASVAELQIVIDNGVTGVKADHVTMLSYISVLQTLHTNQPTQDLLRYVYSTSLFKSK